jgi:hypothetical protein
MRQEGSESLISLILRLAFPITHECGSAEQEAESRAQRTGRF